MLTANFKITYIYIYAYIYLRGSGTEPALAAVYLHCATAPRPPDCRDSSSSVQWVLTPRGHWELPHLQIVLWPKWGPPKHATISWAASSPTPFCESCFQFPFSMERGLSQPIHLSCICVPVFHFFQKSHFLAKTINLLDFSTFKIV